MLYTPFDQKLTKKIYIYFKIAKKVFEMNRKHFKINIFFQQFLKIEVK